MSTVIADEYRVCVGMYVFSLSETPRTTYEIPAEWTFPEKLPTLTESPRENGFTTRKSRDLAISIIMGLSVGEPKTFSGMVEEKLARLLASAALSPSLSPNLPSIAKKRKAPVL